MKNSLLENNRILSSNIDRFKQINKQIEELERELQVTKEENLYDFLTSVLNRRAYEVEAKKTKKTVFYI